MVSERVAIPVMHGFLRRPATGRACVGFGPERCDDHLSRTIESLLLRRWTGSAYCSVPRTVAKASRPLGSDTLERLLGALHARDVRVLQVAALDLAVA